MSKPTVLLITEIRLYPLYGGLYIHIYNVLESLCQHCNVVVLAPPVTADCPLCTKVVAWYPLPEYQTDLWNKVRNGYYLWRPRPSWQAYLQEILQNHQPQVVWFTYGHWGQYAPLVQQQGAIAIMQTQNIQSDLSRQRATTLPFGSHALLAWGRAWMEASHERHLFCNFDRIISLTAIDQQYHAQFVGDTRSLLIPGFIREEQYQLAQPCPRADDLLIITGSFESFQNVQGILWFMETVWPHVQAARPHVRLQLVGKGARQLPAALMQAPQIEAIDTVPDITPYLRRATIAVVPILHGSGIRFKILEALANELPVVSTTLGAQGIAVDDGEHILLADTPVAFTGAILTLLDDATKRAQFGQKGLAILRQHYTMPVNTARMAQLIDTLVKNGAEKEDSL